MSLLEKVWSSRKANKKSQKLSPLKNGGINGSVPIYRKTLNFSSLLYACITRDSNDSNSTKEEKVLTLTNDHREKVRGLVVDQTREWSDMVMRQVTEEHGLRKDHIVQQNECLHKLLLEAQQEQLKELEMRQDR